MLASFFQNEPPAMGPFYVGLGTGGAFLSENGTLADLNEVTGQGYTRQRIERNSSPAGWELRGDFVQSPPMEFTNVHPTNDWEPVDYAFLTLSQSGLEEPVVLIAAVEFPHSIRVRPGDTFRFLFKFRQVTTGLRRERINYAASSLISAGSMVATAEVL